MNKKVTLVLVVILLITFLFFYVKRETYSDLDFGAVRLAALDIVNKAGENKGFTENDLKLLKDTLGPVMYNDKKIFDAVLKYAKRNRSQEVIDLIELYFQTLRPRVT